jgi:hypothetical protein
VELVSCEHDIGGPKDNTGRVRRAGPGQDVEKTLGGPRTARERAGKGGGLRPKAKGKGQRRRGRVN